MDQDVVIELDQLGKKFTRSIKRSLLYGSLDITKSMLGIRPDTSKLRKGEFWSLDNISFKLKRGETLGLIGINGSGKSTLLRLITGIFPPDKGKIKINGKVGSLIAVGSGFHPHMTGRENIFLNGIILGMTRKEVEQKIDSIIEFADIGEFIDSPVSTYSSGMYVRLGFSIAVHADPDILLVDEILSVGDLSFRNKSLRRMNELKKNAKGIIFVSHSLEQIRVLCDRVIVLDKGRIIFDGDVQEGCVMYEELTREIRLDNIQKDLNSSPDLVKNNNGIITSSGGREKVEIMDIGILNSKGEKVNSIGLEESLNLFCEFALENEVSDLYFSAAVIDEQWIKNVIRVFSNEEGSDKYINMPKGTYRLEVKIDHHHLGPGVYIPQIAIRNDSTGETYERAFKQTPFKVVSDGKTLEKGLINVKENWVLKKL